MSRTIVVVALLALAGCTASPKVEPSPANDGTPAPSVVDPDVMDARGAETLCEVHKTKLIEDIVPMWYGYPGEDNFFPEYPHAHTSVAGGCVVFEGQPTRAKVLYCPECRSAYKKDCAEHGWIDPGNYHPTTSPTFAPFAPER